MGKLRLLLGAGALLIIASLGIRWWLSRVPVPAGAPSTYATALRALRQGDDRTAEEALRASIARKPDFGDTYAELGNLLLLRKDLRGAIQALEAAVALGARQPDTRARLAQAYLDARRPEDAYRAVEAALQENPRSTYAQMVRGELLLRDDNLAEARKCFEAAIRENPAYPLAYLKAGYALVKSQKLDEAQQVLERGLKQDPHNPGLHFQLAETYYLRPQASGSAALAEKHYQLAIPDNPGAGSAHARLAELANRRGDEVTAERHWQQALKLEPGNTDALYGLGQLLTRKGNVKGGQALLRRARSERDTAAELGALRARAQARPEDAALACRVGRVALERVLLAEAERQIERAVRWAPDRKEARELRGRLYVRQGRLAEGRKELEIASSLTAAPG